jgi:RNA polymerase subunit RPABC4/transcription elongation factor Spt4
MGLGPAVCQHCQVLAEYTEEAIPVVRNASTKTVSKYTNWFCPICGETDPSDNAGLSGNWDKYEENEKFLRFMTGKLK